MSFLLSLVIIIATDYLALSLFWIRHKKEIINRPTADFSDDLSVINFRKRKKKEAAVEDVYLKKDPEEESEE